MFIHVDCNSFFASCEKVFRPDLWNRPVVVTSNSENNGGIIVALSREAKAAGLKRGNPVFQVQSIIDRYQVAVFPSNFALYTDLSRRIKALALQSGLISRYEPYSIDEFFGQLPLRNEEDMLDTARRLSQLITRATDIPVACGCAPSYTLAKAATYFAKHYPYPHRCCLLNEEVRERALARLPIEEVWGVGWRMAPRLKARGVSTALDLARLPMSEVRTRMTVTGERTWKELHGIPCIDIGELPEKQSICTSRTFDNMITDKERLREAIANFVACCARRLRRQQGVCGSLTLFLLTNSHREDLPQYAGEKRAKLPFPTLDTAELVKAAGTLLDELFKEGFHYKKAGIVLTDILPATPRQGDLFDGTDRPRQGRLMQAVDSVNGRYGPEVVRTSVQGTARNGWKIQGLNGLRGYTTCLKDVIEVK